MNTLFTLLLQTPDTSNIVEKIKRCDVAPSTKIIVSDLLPTFNFLLNTHEKDIVTLFQKIEEENKSVPDTGMIVDGDAIALAERSSDFERHSRVTIQGKEAGLYCRLGNFGCLITDMMELKYPKKRFYLQYEYELLPGRKFAHDLTVLLFGKRPLLVFEIKLRVSANLEDQDCYDLSEFFLQAFWHCLTDLKDFHYFLYKSEGPY